MDKLKSKTGGLFNLKEMAESKDKRRMISDIIELDTATGADQNIPAAFQLKANDSNRKRLESMTVSKIKKELKLKQQSADLNRRQTRSLQRSIKNSFLKTT